MQQELAAQCGLNQTVTAQATLLKRWLNNSQQIILRSFEWPFLRASSPLIVQTAADYSSGTISTTAGSTTATLQYTQTVDRTGWYLQTSSSKDWYRVSAHSIGSASLTLDAAAINDLSGGTFTLRKFFYTTSSSVDRIIQITQSILPYQLIETTPEFFQSFNPGFLSTGTPRLYMLAGLDSSGYPQFRLWPNPDAAINLYVDYIKTATDMSVDGDVPVIPAKWHTTVLIEGAKMQAFDYLDDTRAKDSKTMFYKMIEDMKNEYDIGLHRHRVMTSIDNQPVGGNLGYMPLPFNYPRNS